jgi:hypothetical protein
MESRTQGYIGLHGTPVWGYDMENCQELEKGRDAI